MGQQIASIIGMISGLIAIYSFVTGVKTLPELRAQSRQQRDGGSTSAPSQARQTHSKSPFAPSQPRRRFLISILVSVVSLIVAAIFGLMGSDSAGIMFFLLLLAAVDSLVYVFTLQRFVPHVAFALLNIGGLAILGYALGSFSIGEEAAGTLWGMIAGTGVWIVTLLNTQQSATPG